MQVKRNAGDKGQDRLCRIIYARGCARGPVWSNPAGYFPPSERRAFVASSTGRAVNPRGSPTFEDQIASTMIIAGTPDQVIERLKYLVLHTKPGIMAVWANDGVVSKDDRRRCIQLLCGEVMPAIKEYAASLGSMGSRQDQASCATP